MSKYTREEIEDSYEFKVVKRLLKKEFPFITDIKLTDNWADYRSLLFVDLSMSPTLLLQLLDIPDTPDARKYLNVFTSYSPYLNTLFPSKYDRDGRISDLGKKVQATVTKVQQSPSIPYDMKLPRPISISGWGVDRQSDNT
jgi:hypothetical protein